MVQSYVWISLWMILSSVMAPHHADVIVYGGTSAGITSAIQAAKMGRTVVLLEPGTHLGGIASEGLGGTDIDNHQEFQNSMAVGGLALEFYQRIATHYGRLKEFNNARSENKKNAALWRFESHVAEKVFTDWVGEYPIQVFYHQRLREKKTSVIKRGNRIISIQMESGQVYSGDYFIDATYEGDLLHAAGVSTAIGRERNALYSETRNGIRAETTHAQFKVNVDPYIVPGKRESGIIATIQDEPLGTPGEGDERLQAFCFRVCLTKNPDNQIPFTKPVLYDRDQYEIYSRYEKAGGILYRPVAHLPNGKTDLGAWHDLSHNLYGMNVGYPAGSYATRDRIIQEHRAFTQGLFYYLANDTGVSVDTRKEWSQWGLARDEFTDNAGWPRIFYVRDARRMVSDYVITEHHVKKEGSVPVTDPVAMAFWPPDVHSVRRIIRDGFAYNEGFVFGGDDWRPFGISYRSMIPRRQECTNLITPTCPSSSHIAYGAIRIEFTFMALGQAAGTAASFAFDKKYTFQEVDYLRLRKQLTLDGQVLSLD